MAESDKKWYSAIPTVTWAFAIIAVFFIMLIAWATGKYAECTFHDGLRCGWVLEEQRAAARNLTWYGYYKDIRPDGRDATCLLETLEVKLYESGLMKATGMGTAFDPRGRDSRGQWIHTGFFAGNHVTGSYHHPTGASWEVGSYFLTHVGDGWVGFWIRPGQKAGELLHCPYVLTDTPLEPGEACDSRWGGFFKHRCMTLAGPLLSTLPAENK